MGLYYSGVDSAVVHTTFFCPVCEDWYDLEGETAGSKLVAYADCEVCGYELESERE